MKLEDLKIYKVTSKDEHGEFDSGFSFSEQPGSAEPKNRHELVTPDNLDAHLWLVAFSSYAQAEAYNTGLRDGAEDRTGSLIRMINENLSVVLIEWTESSAIETEFKDYRDV